MTNDTPENTTTHFGYQDVDPATKTRLVEGVFRSVAGRYDLMNDLMSGGLHRAWKRFTMSVATPHPGEQVLDLAGGTGDLSYLLSRRVGPEGLVVLSDINGPMLAVGRDRLLNWGVARNLTVAQANAEVLPFADNSFDLVTIGFGLRNVTFKEKALAAMWRVLRPGGRLVILEFSKPRSALLQRLYDLYSFKIVPEIGHWVTGDKASYRYLVESIRRHPDQETLKGMMAAAGFAHIDYWNLTDGIVAVHRGYKL